MALAALDWSLEDLARAAAIKPSAVIHYLAGGSLGPEPVATLRLALERGGDAGRCRFIMSGEFSGGVAFDPPRIEDGSHRNPILNTAKRD